MVRTLRGLPRRAAYLRPDKCRGPCVSPLAVAGVVVAEEYKELEVFRGRQLVWRLPKIYS